MRPFARGRAGPHARRLALLAGVATLYATAPAAVAQTAAAGATTSGAASATDGAADSGNAPPALQAPTDTLLPALGVSPTDPDVRTHLLDAFGQNPPPAPSSAATGPSWRITPQITVSEQFTTNANGLGGTGIGRGNDTGDDAITLLQPQITITETSQRLRVSLNYAPTGEIFAVNSQDSQFRQQFNGAILATAMPGLLYLDLRGAVFQQPVYAGLGQVNDVALGPNARETVSNVAATPYLVRSFGGTGTLQAGLSYAYTATDAPSALNIAPQNTDGLPFNYGSSWLATRRLFASFGTGEDFGRFQNTVGADSSFYAGTGSSRNAQRVLVTDDSAYAVNRFISALTEIGYENIAYPNAGYGFVGGVWAAGARITPNPDSSLTVQYRHIDGFSAPYAYGSWQLAPRIRLYGGYSEGVSSFDQDQQNSLLSSNQTASGAAAATLLSAPLLNNSGYFGGNQSLNRARRIDLNAAFIADRDTITVNFDWLRTSIVGNSYGVPTTSLDLLKINAAELRMLVANGISPFLQEYLDIAYGPAYVDQLQQLINYAHTASQTGNNITGGVSWNHALTPTLSATLFGGYSRSHQTESTLGTVTSAQASFAVNDRLTEHITAALTYSGSYVISGDPGLFNPSDNTVTISLSKTF